MTRWIVGFVAVFVMAAGALAAELPRRGTLGLALAASDDGQGLKIVQIMNPAATAVQIGDVVVTINGKRLTGPQGVGTGGATYGVKPGQDVKLSILRAGAAMEVSVAAIAAPPPVLDGRPIEMGFAQAVGGPRVRTLLLTPVDTRLARKGRLPTVMILPGVNCGTVESFSSATHPYTRLFKMLTAAGFVVAMADKPGQGDSEGTPCLEGGYNVEEQAFRAAAKGFVADKRVDPKRFYVIGISLGGIQAPLVAESAKAAGIITWGGLVGPWYDYLLTTFNRRSVLQGDDPVALAAYQLHWRQVLAAVFVDGKTPSQIKASMPESFAAVAGGEGNDLSTLAGRAWVFHREVDRAETVRAWNAFDGRLLALHGEFDWVSELHDDRLSVDIVNRRHPGQASLEIVAGNDHVHTKHATLADSLARLGQGAADDAFFLRCVSWLSEQAGR